MFETLDKVLLAGLGAMSITRDRAEKIFDEYVSRGQAEKTARAGFVKELMDAAEKTRAEFEKVISEQVGRTVGTLNLATHDDLHRVEEKLDQLLSRE